MRLGKACDFASSRLCVTLLAVVDHRDSSLREASFAWHTGCIMPSCVQAGGGAVLLDSRVFRYHAQSYANSEDIIAEYSENRYQHVNDNKRAG